MKNEFDEHGVGYVKITFNYKRTKKDIDILGKSRFDYFNETVFKPFLEDYDDKSIYNKYRVFESIKISTEDVRYRCNKIISDVFDNTDSVFYPKLICRKSPCYDNIDEINIIIHNSHPYYNFNNLMFSISKYIKFDNQHIIDIKNIYVSTLKLKYKDGLYEPTSKTLKVVNDIVGLCRLTLEELN